MGQFPTAEPAPLATGTLASASLMRPWDSYCSVTKCLSHARNCGKGFPHGIFFNPLVHPGKQKLSSPFAGEKMMLQVPRCAMELLFCSFRRTACSMSSPELFRRIAVMGIKHNLGIGEGSKLTKCSLVFQVGSVVPSWCGAIYVVSSWRKHFLEK